MAALGGGAVSYERGTPVQATRLSRNWIRVFGLATLFPTVSEGSPSRELIGCRFFFFINLQPLKKPSTTNYAPFALGKGPGSLTDN